MMVSKMSKKVIKERRAYEARMCEIDNPSKFSEVKFTRSENEQIHKQNDYDLKYD